MRNVFYTLTAGCVAMLSACDDRDASIHNILRAQPQLNITDNSAQKKYALPFLGLGSNWQEAIASWQSFNDNQHDQWYADFAKDILNDNRSQLAKAMLIVTEFNSELNKITDGTGRRRAFLLLELIREKRSDIKTFSDLGDISPVLRGKIIVPADNRAKIQHNGNIYNVQARVVDQRVFLVLPNLGGGFCPSLSIGYRPDKILSRLADDISTANEFVIKHLTTEDINDIRIRKQAWWQSSILMAFSYSLNFNLFLIDRPNGVNLVMRNPVTYMPGRKDMFIFDLAGHFERAFPIKSMSQNDLSYFIDNYNSYQNGGGAQNACAIITPHADFPLL